MPFIRLTVGEFIAMRMEEAAEEAFVSESCGEDFAGWEEILIGGVADGHVFDICLVYLLLSYGPRFFL